MPLDSPRVGGECSYRSKDVWFSWLSLKHRPQLCGRKWMNDSTFELYTWKFTAISCVCSSSVCYSSPNFHWFICMPQVWASAWSTSATSLRNATTACGLHTSPSRIFTAQNAGAFAKNCDKSCCLYFCCNGVVRDSQNCKKSFDFFW